MHNFRTFSGVKLQPDFEKRDLVAQLFNDLKRFPFRGCIQSDDEFVSCFGHSGSEFVMSSEVETSLYFRRTIRDSSTSLGMTEQIAGNYASLSSRKDQSVTQNP